MKILILFLAIFLFSCSNPPIQVVEPPKAIISIESPKLTYIHVNATSYDCHRDTLGNVSSLVVFENKNDRPFYVSGIVLFTLTSGESTTANFSTYAYKVSVANARGKHYLTVQTPFKGAETLISCQVKSFQVEESWGWKNNENHTHP